MAKPGRAFDDENLPPERATAQKIREEELIGLLSLSRRTEKDRLTREIDALARIVKSDRAALKMNALSASDRLLLADQIQLRSARMVELKQRLANLSA